MFDELNELVNPDVVIGIADNEKELIVKEPAVDSKIKKLHISGLSEQSFAFTLDHQPGSSSNRCFKQLSPYINISNGKGVNKGCDLVLVTQSPDGFWTILLFDIKSDKPKISETEKQLKNSELFLRYIINMLTEYYGIDSGNIKYKKAIVTTDQRTIRKSSISRPNMVKSSTVPFNIKAVKVNRNKEARVHLRALLV